MRLFLASLLCLSAAPALATMAEALSMEDMCDSAQRIAVARVEGSAARYDDRGRIVTDYALVVDEGLKGCDAGDSLELTTFGGRIGDLAMTIAGSPQLTVGSRYVIFAQERAARLRPVGMSQGTMPILDQPGEVPLVRRGGQGLDLVGRQQGPAGQPLPDLIARIRTILQ